MDAELKSILLKLVGEIQDLRVNQALLAGHVGSGISPADAQDAKKLATKEIAKQYAALRKRIGESK